MDSVIRLLVAHVVGSLHPSSGGPARTVTQLCDALARHQYLEVALLSQRRTGEPTVPSAEARVGRTVVQSNSMMAIKLGIPIRQELTQLVRQRHPVLIHSHGLWVPVNHWAARSARGSKIPLIIQPRGMLEPWAMNHKAAKKFLAMALFQRRDLETAKVFFATADSEYEGIRALGLRQPVAVIPNGVQFGSASAANEIGTRSPKAFRTVLFLSRVHPKKGILNLLHAWAAVAPSGWRLKIAGPNEGEHLAEVLATAQRLGIAEAVEYVGEIDGAAKALAYDEADLFVLPTFSENFGVVIAEALAHGLPVITTRGAPWADLETYRCGWWVDVGVAPLANVLREATALGDDERRTMGERGRSYVRRFDWTDIATQTINVYRWMLGRGPQPACVRTT